MAGGRGLVEVADRCGVGRGLGGRRVLRGLPQAFPLRATGCRQMRARTRRSCRGGRAGARSTRGGRSRGRRAPPSRCPPPAVRLGEPRVPHEVGGFRRLACWIWLVWWALRCSRAWRQRRARCGRRVEALVEVEVALRQPRDGRGEHLPQAIDVGPRALLGRRHAGRRRRAAARG